jgi:hypothetical protein
LQCEAPEQVNAQLLAFLAEYFSAPKPLIG